MDILLKKKKEGKRKEEEEKGKSRNKGHELLDKGFTTSQLDLPTLLCLVLLLGRDQKRVANS